MDALKQVINFGPGPAKLPRSVRLRRCAWELGRIRIAHLGGFASLRWVPGSQLPTQVPPPLCNLHAPGVQELLREGFWKNAFGKGSPSGHVSAAAAVSDCRPGVALLQIPWRCLFPGPTRAGGKWGAVEKKKFSSRLCCDPWQCAWNCMNGYCE